MSRDLQQEFPDMKGFSLRNLELIRKWYLYWSQSDVIATQVVSQLEKAPIFQIPWGQNLLIISKAKSTEEALFYVQKTIENNWSIADNCLRDVYVRGKYRDVILPMVLLRCLDNLLEDTKDVLLDIQIQNNVCKI